MGQAALVHRISMGRKRVGLQSRNKRSWGITLNTVLADVMTSLQRLPGVRATDHECMWIQVTVVEPGDSPNVMNPNRSGMSTLL